MELILKDILINNMKIEKVSKEVKIISFSLFFTSLCIYVNKMQLMKKIEQQQKEIEDLKSEVKKNKQYWHKSE